LLRGGFEGDVTLMVGTAELVVVAAVAVGGHDCGVHFLATLVQVVEDGPVGPVDLTVAVPLARGELAVVRAPIGALEHSMPVGHAVGDAAGARVATVTREHAQRVHDDTAPDRAPALPLDLSRRGFCI
jgi:hypothetical protein